MSGLRLPKNVCHALVSNISNVRSYRLHDTFLVIKNRKELELAKRGKKNHSKHKDRRT